jgi:hypothetical protein
MIDLPAGFKLVSRAASGGGQSDGLANRVEWQESRGNQGAVSPRGAFGVMQLMPDTARDPGFGVAPLDPNAPDPEVENRRVGRDYLNAMLERYGGDQEAALAAYNWGPDNADKWVASGKGRGRLPRETQGYLNNILGDEQGAVASASQPMRLAPPDEQPAAPQQPAQGGIPLPPGFKKVGASRSQVEAPAPAPTAPAPQPEAPTEPSVPVTAMGLAKSLGSGLQEGVTSLLGLPGDIRHYATKAGVPENMPLGPLLPPGAPTSETLQGAYEAAGGPTYTPQNTAEEYTKTLGSFAPNAIGGAGLLRKGAQVAVPALLSETGGQVGRTISPQAETAGRVAGALTGAGRASKPRLPKGPTSPTDIKALSQEAYDAAENAGLQIKGESFFNFANSLAKDKVLKSLNINPKLHPNLSALKDEIVGLVKGPQPAPSMSAMTGTKRPWTPAPMSLQEFDNVRRNALGVSMRSPDADERRIAGHIVDRLDNYFDNLKSADVAAGDVRGAATAVKSARDLWRRYRKSEEIEVIIEKAKDDAGRFTLSGKENAIRTGFRQLSKKIASDKRVANRFSDEEKKTIRELSRGWNARGVLSFFGKMSPNSISLAGGVTAYGLGGDPTYLGAASILGMGTRGASGMIASKKARDLQKLIGGGGKKLPGGRGVVPLSGVSATAQEDK